MCNTRDAKQGREIMDPTNKVSHYLGSVSCHIKLLISVNIRLQKSDVDVGQR